MTDRGVSVGILFAISAVYVRMGYALTLDEQYHIGQRYQAELLLSLDSDERRPVQAKDTFHTSLGVSAFSLNSVAPD